MATALKMILFVIFAIISNTVSVLLYFTENTIQMEAFDCIYYANEQTVQFCRRFDDGHYIFQSNYSLCMAEGEKWSFIKLIEHNITPWELLLWNSSIETADDYGRVFYNR
jgi:hypothetical protein